MSNVKPTRSELLQTKTKIKLAKSGHKLLKRKRDGLITEMFKILKKAKAKKSSLNEKFIKSEKIIEKSKAIEGSSYIRSVAFASKSDPTLNVKSKRVMGVIVPDISYDSDHFQKEINERGYGIIGTSENVDNAQESYADLLKEIIIAAELETTIRRLLFEIDKIKRRVNALEFNVIPRKEEDANFIKLRLEEMEREDTFRLKRFKKKVKRRASKAAN